MPRDGFIEISDETRDWLKNELTAQEVREWGPVVLIALARLSDHMKGQA